MRPSLSYLALLSGGIMAAAAMAGCQSDANSGPEITAIEFARAATRDPEVTATEPTGARQDTTLDVEVSGSGFDNGSAVALTLGGVPTDKVRTNSTRYRNPKTLIANITIAADAEVDLYDVEVTTASRKKGIGTEMFEVYTAQTVTVTFRDATTDRLTGDGRLSEGSGGTSYTSEECGVVAQVPDYSGNVWLNTKNNPIKRSEADACGGTEGRTISVRFDRADAGQPLEWDGQRVNAKWLSVYYDIRTIPVGSTEPRKLHMTFDDKAAHTGGNGWGQACPWRLEFDSEKWGSSDVQVTRVRQQPQDSYDEWIVEAGPDDVAACLGGKNTPTVIGYYYVPFQMRVVRKPLSPDDGT